MSRTRPRSRPMNWEARAQRAQRRLTLYNNVDVEINRVQSYGGRVETMRWRRPDVEIHDLLQAGGQALRALGQGAPSKAPHEQIEQLERAVTAPDPLLPALSLRRSLVEKSTRKVDGQA